jgi:hypothetical protein
MTDDKAATVTTARELNDTAPGPEVGARSADAGESGPEPGARSLWRWWPERVLLLVAAVALLMLRPPDPFQGDEVLYLSALDHFNVAAQHPHPPGAPAYVAAGWLLRLAVRSSLFSLQLLSVLAGLASLALVWRLVLGEGGRRGAALAAALGLAVMPGFLFYSNVALPDVPGVAATLATFLLAVWALDELRFLPAVALAAAVTFAVTPHLLLALAPVGVALLVVVVRKKAWRRLGVALAVAAAASIVLWLPAILLTGWNAYWTATRVEAANLARYDGPFMFPRAAVKDLLHHWFVFPLGEVRIAVPFYLLAASGAVAWWRAGRRRLVALAFSSALVFSLGAACSLPLHWAVRHGLPALPFLAVLVAGNLAWRPRAVRYAAALGGLGLAAALLVWVAPTLRQRLQHAPIWGCLEYVTTHHDPHRTVVTAAGALWPHAEYVLRRAGFEVKLGTDDAGLEKVEADGKEEVLVGLDPVPGMVTETEVRWDTPHLQQLSFGRYDRCVVQRPGPVRMPRFGFAWSVRDDGWLLWGSSTLRAPADGMLYRGVVCAKIQGAVVTSALFGTRVIGQGQCAGLLLLPGSDGSATVTASKDWVIVEPIAFKAVQGPRPPWLPQGTTGIDRLSGEGTFVVPAAARAAGANGRRWQTGLVLVNSSYDDAKAVVAFAPAGVANTVLRAAEHPLVAGAYLKLDDILTSDGLFPPGHDVFGALLVTLSDPSGHALADPSIVQVEARTSNQAADAPESGGVVPLVPATRGLLAGAVGRVRLPAGLDDVRGTVGAAALGPGPVAVEVTLEGAGWQQSTGARLKVLTNSQEIGGLPIAPGLKAVRFTVVEAPEGTRVFPFVSLLSSRSGALTYLTAAAEVEPGKVTFPELPFLAFLTPAGAR